MKHLLTWGASGLMTAALLMALFYSGMGWPFPWLRAGLMAWGSMACFYLLVKYRKRL